MQPFSPHCHIRLVRTLDEITKGELEGSGPGTSWTRPRSNFAVSGVAIDRENLPDRGFDIAFGSGFEGKVKALLLNHLFNDMSCNTSVIFSSVISKTAVFALAVEGDTDGNSRIVSPVLSVTIGNCAINRTMEAIEITFLVPQVMSACVLIHHQQLTCADIHLVQYAKLPGSTIVFSSCALQTVTTVTHSIASAGCYGVGVCSFSLYPHLSLFDVTFCDSLHLMTHWTATTGSQVSTVCVHVYVCVCACVCVSVRAYFNVSLFACVHGVLVDLHVCVHAYLHM